MKRIMIDPSKCESCLGCYLACMESHDADDARNRIVIGLDGGRLPMFCRHCADPKCEAACMSGALSRNEKTGHVKYDESRCGSCFMCVMNCPYGIPKPDRARKTILKCDFCRDREEGPACVAACPTHAIFVEEAEI